MNLMIAPLRKLSVAVTIAMLVSLLAGIPASATSQGTRAGTGHWVRAGGPATGASDLVFDPVDPNVVYAANGENYVLKSLDAGDTWTPMHQGIATSVHVHTLAIDPFENEVVYAGTNGGPAYTGAGVLKSIDGGVTWSRENNGLPSDAEIDSIAVDPNNHLTIYAGSRNQMSLFKSIDGAESWVLSDSGLPEDYGFVVRSLVVDPGNPSTVYAGAEGWDPLGGVYKSMDAGATWAFMSSEQLSQNSVYEFAIDPRGHALYAAAWDPAYEDKGGVFKTSDGASTWFRVKRGPSAYAITLDPAHPRVLFAGTETGMAKSTDQGHTWRNASDGITGAPVTAVEVDPSANGSALAGTYAAIFRTLDGGLHWSAVTNLAGGLGYAIAVDPTQGDTIYAGSQQDGVFKSMDGGDTWVQDRRGLPRLYVNALAVDPANPNTVYAAPMSSGVFKSVDGGLTWSRANSGISQINVESLAVDPATGTVFAGELDAVYRSTDGGSTWQKSEALTDAAEIRALVIDPTDPAVLYAGGYGNYGGVYKSTDGGATWVKASDGIGQVDDNAVAGIVIDPTSPTTLFAVATCTQGEECGDAHVYKSTDGAATWEAVYAHDWSSFTSIAMDPTDPTVVYAGGVGGGVGVVRTTDAGTTWESINAGLTQDADFVESLAVSSNAVPFAGTWGGIFTFIE